MSYIICSNIPYAGLYFVEELAKTRKLEFVIWQKEKISIRSVISKSLFYLKNGRKIKNILSKNLLNFKSIHHSFFIYQKLLFFSIRYKFKLVITNNINNDKQVNKILNESQSSFCLVLGGQIIEKKVLDQYKGFWINGHGGILPNYRGLCSEYWCVKNKDYENIGCTIHRLTPLIDSGTIIEKSIINFDSEETLFSLCLRNHANLIDTFLQTVKSNKLEQYTSIEIQKNIAHSNYYSTPKTISYKKLLSSKTKDI